MDATDVSSTAAGATRPGISTAVVVPPVVCHDLDVTLYGLRCVPFVFPAVDETPDVRALSEIG